MTRRKLFLWLAAASGYIGIGMLLGYSFGDHSTNTALWVGTLLVLVAALLLGMYISARNDNSQKPNPVTTTDTASAEKL